MAFDRALADVILERLADGMSLRKAVASQVAPSTILRWANGFDDEAKAAGFVEQYARARTIGYQVRADEIIDISDEESFTAAISPTGTIVNAAEVEQGAEVVRVEVKLDSVGVARARNRIDARRWELSKMLPKVYGDKLDLAHSGEVGVRSITRRILPPPTPPEERGK